MPIEAIWGVYHANGGLMGELAYAVGKLRGTAHCELCDITHGTVRKKPEWKELEDELDVPVHLVHLDEQPEELAEVTEGTTPCVVGQSGGRWTLLLGPDELRRCDGSVDCFRERLEAALAASPEG